MELWSNAFTDGQVTLSPLQSMGSEAGRSRFPGLCRSVLFGLSPNRFRLWSSGLSFRKSDSELVVWGFDYRLSGKKLKLVRQGRDLLSASPNPTSQIHGFYMELPDSHGEHI